MPSELTVRQALPGDEYAVHALLEPHVCAGVVLPREPDEILSRIDNFIVAECGGMICGCVALRDFGDGLEEIRSLVVDTDHGRRGIGSRLIQAALDKAHARHTTCAFALTLVPEVFESNGFHRMEKERFPQKVWSDCAVCPKRECCDEIAMVRELP